MEKTIDECFVLIRNGANIKQGKVSGGFPITRIETISNDKFNRDKLGYAGITDIEKYSSYIMEDGDLLMSHINSVKYLGRTVLYKKIGNEIIIHGMNLLMLKADRNVIMPAYAHYAFSSSFFKRKLACITKKSVNQASFSIGDLKRIKIDVPNIDEQLSVVKKLETIDSIQEICQTQLTKLDELVKSRFIEMFGEPIKNTQNRKTTKFINVVKMQRGFDLPIHCRQQNGAIPVYGSNGVLDYHNVAKVQGGGIITGRSGTIGKVFYTESDFWPLNTSLFSVDTHENNIIYLAYLLEMFDLARFVEGTGVPTLNRNSFHNQQIIDVEISEQNQFADFVQQVDKSKLVAKALLAKAELLREKLMQDYFC